MHRSYKHRLSVWRQGWRGDPGWWTDSGVSLWPALVTSHSLYTWEDTQTAWQFRTRALPTCKQQQISFHGFKKCPWPYYAIMKVIYIAKIVIVLKYISFDVCHDKLYLVIRPSGEVKVMQETPTWTISWDPSLNWTHTSPLVS